MGKIFPTLLAFIINLVRRKSLIFLARALFFQLGMAVAEI